VLVASAGPGWALGIDAATFAVSAAVLGPAIAASELGGAAVWGTVMGAMGVGALAGSLVAIRIRPSRPLVLGVPCFAMFAAPVALLAAGASAPLIAVGTSSPAAG
jgi:hypothetical protein